MNHLKRFVLPLLLCAALLLCGCEDLSPSTTPTLPLATTPSTDPPASTPLRITDSYRIVFAANATSTVQEAAKQLMNGLHMQTGIFLPISVDSLSPTDREICLGLTNRVGADAPTGEREVLICAVDSRIFILASTESCLTAAIELFLEQLTVESGNVTLPADLNVRQTVTPIEQEEQTVKVKLMTYNIANGRDVAYDYRLIANDILKSGAEIVALQEVDQNTDRNNKQDTLALLKEYTGWQYGFFVAGLKNYRNGQYGVAILSKHPIVSTSSVELPENPNANNPERRELLEAVIRVGETELTCFVCHCNQVSIQEQLGAMAEAAAGKDPYVIMGDFNYSKLPLFQTVFPNASFANLSPAPLVTTDDGHQFDNMILSKGIKKGPVIITPTDHSDHHMLLCEVEIPIS